MDSRLKPGRTEQGCSQRHLQELAYLADEFPVLRREQGIRPEPVDQGFHSGTGDDQKARLREQRPKQKNSHQPQRAASINHSRLTWLGRRPENGVERDREGVRENSSIELHGLWNRKEHRFME